MALDLKKGLGSVKLPTIPWHKLGKLTKMHKILISVGIVTVLWGGFIYFLYMPQTETITRMNQDLKRASDQLSRLRKVEQNLREFKKKLKETEAKFKTALQLLPDKEEIPTLLSSISGLGASSGLEFLLFKPQNEVRRNFYAEIPLKLEISGSYHNVASFFDQVGRLSRIVNIGSVNMTTLAGAQSPDGSMVLKTSCTATTYKFIEVKEDPKKRKRKRK
jgi:type IV pilus assembly protein PilO